jgi:pyruvate kinase
MCSTKQPHWRELKNHTHPVVGNRSLLSVSYAKLPAEITKGQKIMINDGKIRLTVTGTNKKDTIQCRIDVGGLLTSRKGFNVPGAHLTTPAISAKDKKDIDFALAERAEYIAVSFVRNAKDLSYLQKIQKSAKYPFKIVSKIETQEAIDNLESIIQSSDIVMVARGDLAVEVGYERVPVIQKRIMSLCDKYHKQVIVATEVMSSMVDNPSPTRAEISDIAGAVFDHADYIMLSNETAVGSYPVACIDILNRVITEVEKSTK